MPNISWAEFSWDRGFPESKSDIKNKNIFLKFPEINQFPKETHLEFLVISEKKNSLRRAAFSVIDSIFDFQNLMVNVNIQSFCSPPAERRRKICNFTESNY